MKITLESTGTVRQIVKSDVGEIVARIWKGETEDGTPVVAYIALISPQTHDAERVAAFDHELRQVEAKREISMVDYRLIL